MFEHGIRTGARAGDTHQCSRCAVTLTLLAGYGWTRCPGCSYWLEESVERLSPVALRTRSSKLLAHRLHLARREARVIREPLAPGRLVG